MVLVLGSQGPKSQGLRVLTLKVLGLSVLGLWSQGRGSQVLILDYALFSVVCCKTYYNNLLQINYRRFHFVKAIHFVSWLKLEVRFKDFPFKKLFFIKFLLGLGAQEKIYFNFRIVKTEQNL